MGVSGFRKWLDERNITHLVNHAPPAMDHVLFDMNSLLHLAYNKQEPTIPATRKSLLANLELLLSLFQPRRTVTVAFDGPPPIAKLSEQRRRRKSQPGPSGCEHVPQDQRLREGALTTGHPFMGRIEAEVEEWFLRYMRLGSTAATELCFSGSRVPGEGETKLAERMAHLSRATDAVPYVRDDRVCIIGNDSDLVLNALLCTPYHNLFVVNPQSKLCTSVGDLMRSWLNPHREPCLALAQLPSARIDFAFLTLLRGCDHFPGLERGADGFWAKYCRLRAGAARRDSRLVMHAPDGDGTVRTLINAAFLREIVASDHSKKAPKGGGTKWQRDRRAFEKKQRTQEPAPGVALLQGVLWALATGFEGACPSYGYRFQGPDPCIDALRSAASKVRLSTLAPLRDDTPPLRPLEVYVAVTPDTSQLPMAVREVLDLPRFKQRKLNYDSTGSLVRALSEVFEAVTPDALAPAERAMLLFDTPRLHRRVGGAVVSGEWAPAVDPAASLQFAYDAGTLAAGLPFALAVHDGTLTVGAPKAPKQRPAPPSAAEEGVEEGADEVADEVADEEEVASEPE